MFGQGDAKKCDYPLKESAAFVPFVVADTSICGVFQSITHIICSFKLSSRHCLEVLGNEGVFKLKIRHLHL